MGKQLCFHSKQAVLGPHLRQFSFKKLMYRYRYWYLIIFHIGIGIGIGEFLFFLWVSVNPFSFQRYRYLHWLKRAYRYRYRLNENSISVYHYCTCTSGKTIFGYIYVVDQLLFFIVALIKTFYFGYIFSVILGFFVPYWAIFGVGIGFKNWFGVYHIDQ